MILHGLPYEAYPVDRVAGRGFCWGEAAENFTRPPLELRLRGG